MQQVPANAAENNFVRRKGENEKRIVQGTQPKEETYFKKQTWND